MEDKQKIHIIGAGVAGLTAALVLEERGFEPVIYEAAPLAGGRVQTLAGKHNHFDLGFQVLLDAYPYANKYLNLTSLNLLKFKPGTAIFKYAKNMRIGDPMRDLSVLFPTLFSGVGTWADYFKIAKLNRQLKQKSPSAIFNSDETTTIEYLKEYGFSDKIIRQFFKPFFAGIFLEDKLDTSSRMFEFVFKMLAEGNATIPKNGMGEIIVQLKQQLKHTKIHYHTPVKNVKPNQILLENGESISADYIIVATAPSKLISNLRNQQEEWNSCENFYFSCENKVMDPDLIGLVAEQNYLVNNFHYLKTEQTNSKANLLSVTIVKNHPLGHEQLIEQVKKELLEICGIKVIECLEHFKIEKALPKITDMRYVLNPSETQLLSGVFLAGDHLLNPSLNAAFASGEAVAKGVIEQIGGNFGVEQMEAL